MLVLASAAIAEVDAAGGDAVGRGREDHEGLGGCVDDLAGEDEAQSVRPGGGEGAAVFRLLYLILPLIFSLVVVVLFERERIGELARARWGG